MPGTQVSLNEARNFIETNEHQQGLKVTCPEKITYCKGFINAEQLEKPAQPLAKNEYRQYFISVLKDSALR